MEKAQNVPSEDDLALIDYGSVHSRALWDLMTQISANLENKDDDADEQDKDSPASRGGDSGTDIEKELATSLDLKKHLDSKIHFSSHPPNINVSLMVNT